MVVDTTAYADNGADRILKAGQRKLDRMFLSDKGMLGKNVQRVAADINLVTFSDCRAIKSAYVICLSTMERTELEKDERLQIETMLLAGKDDSGGVPLYYAPGLFRAAPRLSLSEAGALPADTVDDIIAEASYSYNGIIFYPRTDEPYIVVTEGLFYTPWFTSDTEENFWSANHPEILVMAGQMMLEAFSRNTSGMDDWRKTIKELLTEIEMDAVEEQIAAITELEG